MNTDSHNKGDCGTSFKSSAKLREFDNGPIIAHTKDDGQYTWPDAMAGNVIEFDVETKESDTCFAKLVTMDLEYVGRLTNSVTQSLGEDATPDAIMDEVMKNIDLSKMFITVRSKSIETDSSGKYTGQFTIENTFREMPLFVMLSYGYSGKAERSDWETAWDETISEVLIIIAEEIVFALICAAIVAGSGGVASGVVVAMYSAKAVKWGHRAKHVKKGYTTAKTAKLAAKGEDVIRFTGKGAKGFGKAAFASKAALRGASRTSARAGLYYLSAAAHMAAWMGGYWLLQSAAERAGTVDINKSGCQFPVGGYTHMYSFAVGGGDEEWLTFLSTMTPESVGYMGTGVETQAESSGIVGTGIDSPFLIYGGITILGLLLLFMFSGDEEEGGDA